jgi:hypothetical protein
MKHVVISTSGHCDITPGTIGTVESTDGGWGYGVSVTAMFGRITAGGVPLAKQTRTVYCPKETVSEVHLTAIHQPSKREGEKLFFTIGHTIAGKERYVTRTLEEYSKRIAETQGPGRIVETGGQLWWKANAS